MLVKDIETIVVSVPLIAPLRWAMGTLDSTTRTIIILHTDEGITGYGETVGSQAKEAIEKVVKPYVIGSEIFNVEKLLAKLGFSHRHHAFLGYQLRPLAAFEMACWDAMGKAVGKPTCDLLGGQVRERVEFTGYVYPRYKGKLGVGGESTPEEISHYCKDIIKKYGYRMLEFKLGIFPPKTDLEIIKTVRNEVGEDIEIRIDPNSTWSPETSIRIMRRMEEFGISNIEEPCFGLQALSRVKNSTNIPISTHAQLHIPEIVRMGSADAIAGDPHECGGILPMKKIIAAAEIHNLGIWLHSNAELGISTSAYIHISASSPHMIHPNQGTYEHVVNDVIKGGKLRIKDGAIEVSGKPGLGVDLDERNIKKYHEVYLTQGETGFSQSSDSERPGWKPVIPSW